MPDGLKNVNLTKKEMSLATWMITVHPEWLVHKRRFASGDILTRQVSELLRRKPSEKDERRLAREVQAAGTKDVWENQKLMIFHNWPTATKDAVARAMYCFMNGVEAPEEPKLIIEAKR